MVVSYYWIKNRSSRPISDSFAWPSPYEVVYRPHPILIATCRQVSGCPSSRRTVWGRGSPRVTPRWEGRGSRAPVPLPSDHTEPVLHAFLWELSICQNEQILFFFLIKIMPSSYTTVHLQSTKKWVTSVSITGLKKHHHLGVTSKICCQDAILVSTLSLLKVDP